MFGVMPVGSVCPFAGQVEFYLGKNEAWNDSSCAGEYPKKPLLSEKAPKIFPESQGWMLCDGRWLSVDSYPELHAVIGWLYGKKINDSTREYRIPDYRGLFLRGFDAAAGMDPEADERIAPDGFYVANVVGSAQCDSLQDHTHNYDVVQLSGISKEGRTAGISVTSKSTTSPNSPARFGAETRPKNVAVNYLIRYR